MGIREWFRRKKEPEPTTAVEEPVEERARRFDGTPSPARPTEPLPLALDYIADMLSDKRLVPSYLRGEMAMARRLPAEAWEMARKHEDECPVELMEIRSAALEHARRVAALCDERSEVGRGQRMARSSSQTS